MKGKQFLKVTGILMIIGGGLGIIFSLIAIAGVAALAYLGADMGALIFSSVLAIVGAVIELVAGILGVKNCDKPEKANTCIVMGALVAVLTVVSMIVNAVAGGSFSVLSLVTGLVLPGLYIAGAVMNKKPAA